MCDWLYGFWQKSGLGTGAGGRSGGGSCRSGQSSWPSVGAEGCSCGSAVHGSKKMSHVAVQSILLLSPSTVAFMRFERGRVAGDVSLAVQPAAEVMASMTSVSDPPRAQTTTSVLQMSSLLECPVCRNYALPPIMQCENGHHLCAPCRKNVAMCPVCRAPKGNNRNLALEKLAESTLFPCKYRSKGCTTSLLIADKKRHENSCERGTRNLHSQADIDRSGDGLVLDMSMSERLCNGADLVMDVTISVAPSFSGDNVL
nr:E3 ubiquitin-protein ligase Siah2-like [Rhipicephalus microplus]